MAIDWSRVSPQARAGIMAQQEAQKFNPIYASHDTREAAKKAGKSVSQIYHEKRAIAASKTSYGGSNPEQTRAAAVASAEQKAVQAGAEHVARTGGTTTVQLTKQRVELSADPDTGAVTARSGATQAAQAQQIRDSGTTEFIPRRIDIQYTGGGGKSTRKQDTRPPVKGFTRA